MAEKRVAGLDPQTARDLLKWFRANAGRPPQPSNAPNGKLISGEMRTAKITGVAVVSGAAQHSWEEVRWNITTKVWDDTPEGDSGTTSENYMINLAAYGTSLENDTIVQIYKAEDPITRKTFWVGGASGSLPTGQYQYMVYQMTSNNQAGFDYVRLHPPV